MLDLKRNKKAKVTPLPNKYQLDISERTILHESGSRSQSIVTNDLAVSDRRPMRSFQPDLNDIDAKLYENIVDVAGLEKWR